VVTACIRKNRLVKPRDRGRNVVKMFAVSRKLDAFPRGANDVIESIAQRCTQPFFCKTCGQGTRVDEEITRFQPSSLVAPIPSAALRSSKRRNSILSHDVVSFVRMPDPFDNTAPGTLLALRVWSSSSDVLGEVA
jgi:hypothetical protein